MKSNQWGRIINITSEVFHKAAAPFSAYVDDGENWFKVSADDAYMQRISSTYGWVFGQIRVDPNDPDTIYIMGIRSLLQRNSARVTERSPLPG